MLIPLPHIKGNTQGVLKFKQCWEGGGGAVVAIRCICCLLIISWNFFNAFVHVRILPAL